MTLLHLLKHVLALVLGALLIPVGLAGLVLPIIPGILTLLAAAALLSYGSPRTRAFLQARVEGLRDRTGWDIPDVPARGEE